MSKVEGKVKKERKLAPGLLSTHKPKVPRWAIILTGVGLLGLAVTLALTSLSQGGVNQAESQRTVFLAAQETVKEGVLDDLRAYLQVKDNSSYLDARSKFRATSEYKQLLYGSSYNSLKFLAADTVTLVDAQYNIADNGKTIYYVLANVTKAGKTAPMNFLVYTSHGMVYDIQTY